MTGGIFLYNIPVNLSKAPLKEEPSTMSVSVHQSLVANSRLTVTDGDCVIEGDVGAGSVIVVTGGSLSVRGTLGDDVEVVVAPAVSPAFAAAWRAYLSDDAQSDAERRRALAGSVRRCFNAAAGSRDVSLNGAIGKKVRIACVGEVRLRGEVAEQLRIVAGGGIYIPRTGRGAELAAGQDIMIDQAGDHTRIFAGRYARVMLLGERSLIMAGQIVGTPASRLPPHTQGSRDIMTGTQMSYLYNGKGIARLRLR